MLVLNTPDKTKVLTLETSRPFPVVVGTPSDAINLPYSISNISALRAQTVPGSADVIRRPLGYYNPGDVEMPEYRWVPTSTATDNGGTVIRPNSVAANVAGRWIALWTGQLNLKWFGAIGDGASANKATNQAAINNALAVANATTSIIYAPAGNYYTVGGHVAGADVAGLIGDGVGVTNFRHDDANACFEFLNTLLFDGLLLENFSINNLNMQTTLNGNANARGMVIGNMAFCTIRNVEIENYIGANSFGIYFVNTRQWTEDLMLQHVHVRNCKACIVFGRAGGTESYASLTMLDVVVVPIGDQIGVLVRDGVYIYGGFWGLKLNLEGENATGIYVIQQSRIVQCFFSIMAEGPLVSQRVIAVEGNSEVIGHGSIKGFDFGDANAAVPNVTRLATVEPGSKLMLEAYKGLMLDRASPSANRFYIGRINRPDAVTNFVKYVVKCFSGRPENTHCGIATFTVTCSNNTIRINRSIDYGYFSGADIKIYDNGGQLDVAVSVTETAFPWLNIQAWRYDAQGCHEVVISAPYDAVGKTDVTPTPNNVKLVDSQQRTRHGTDSYWGGTVFEGGSEVGVGISAQGGIIARPGGVTRLEVKTNGRLFLSIPTFADNAAALAGGMAYGEVYMSNGSLRIVI